MEVYDRVAKVVAPKKAKLAEAQGELAMQMEKLTEKRTELAKVLSKFEISILPLVSKKCDALYVTGFIYKHRSSEGARG